MCEVEVWVVVDEAGNSSQGPTRADAWTRYEEETGWDEDSPVGLRWAQIVVLIPEPMAVVLSATVPELDTANVALSVKPA